MFSSINILVLHVYYYKIYNEFNRSFYIPSSHSYMSFVRQVWFSNMFDSA
jgi:hypothetical protein